MKTFTKLLHSTLLTSLLTSTVFTANAEVFYENNYDDGKTPKYVTDPLDPSIDGQPVWALPSAFKNVYGPGNNFNLTNTTSHSGSYSLKFTYEARNDICNTCGTRVYKHIGTGHDGVNYFLDNAGTDLSIADNPATEKDDDGPKARVGRYVYNLDNGFSKWKITSVTNGNKTNDKLNLDLVKAGINGEKTINSGDEIGIIRQCGVDGLVGTVKGKNDINRRSDCNNLIAWFTNVSPQPPGTSIFRRTYLKAEVTSPIFHQKLHYFRPDHGGPNEGSIVTFGDSNIKTAPNTDLLLSGMKPYGGAGIYRPGIDNGFDGLTLKRGIWYYLEEEYQAATLNPVYDPEYNPKSTSYNASKYPTPDPLDARYNQYNSDGAYRIWFSKAGHEPTSKSNTSFKLEGIPLPPITGSTGPQVSFWGNFQHHTHTRGSWYIDDVIISNSWNGPTASSGTNTAPPISPTTGD